MVGSGRTNAEELTKPVATGDNTQWREREDWNGAVDGSHGYNTRYLRPGARRGPQRNGSFPGNGVTLSQGSLDNTSTSDTHTREGSVTGSEHPSPLYANDENAERGNWSGRFDFLLSLLGYAVGLGSIWRFPYLCFRNGGGAFLFPYLIMTVVIGTPVFFLEASLGQFCSAGPMACWDFAPLFKGLGIAMVMVSALTSIYYNMIMGWSLYYLFASFTSNLPWRTCDNPEWNTQDCSLKLPLVDCKKGEKLEDGTCNDATSGSFLGIWNYSVFTNATGRRRISPSEEYWNGRALKISSGIDDFGTPKWDMTLCLLLAWILCFLCLLKGIKTTGKVVYFTAIFPYVVLIILFFRGVTLDNAGEGIKYYIIPDFGRLADARVWNDAANQVFFALSVAGGGLITLSSYNRFKNNIFRDTMIVVISDTATCIFGGFVIFSFLGYMAGQLGLEVKDVVKDGAGLAFVVYPEAVSSLPPATLWAILFFIMLLTLGLDSQFAMVETVLTGILDQFPHLRPKKSFVILIICIVFFFLGLPLACPGGMYLLQLMDSYAGGLTLIIVAFFEIVAVIYVYGCNRFCRDIHIMIGTNIFIYWKVTWMVLSPLTIAFIFIFMLVDYSPSKYGDYLYPRWADGVGWLFALSSIIFIPLTMVYKLCRETEGDTVLQKLRLLTTPKTTWGPALPKFRELVDYVDGFEVDPHKTRMQERFPSWHTNKAFVSDTKSSPLQPTHAPLGLRSQSMYSGFSGISGGSTNTYETNV
ncbi:hypothetical protein C0Q70_15679 [Pomacea canaliculata]|uniref:Transporter n=1 Tax=Pomacea canaliculata TaxID=400727 RepID=A0A2T7NVI5_POMCA|nr:sodium- and chloride-dependent glycine transporter 1-like [Pomacea canaliculata]PVD25181.1 hypothetical protein C0Q70_15679 [Pomacea canaliculata]